MKALVSVVIAALALACQSQNTDEVNLSERALKGKEIFEAKECSKCHYLGDEAVASEAPDLLNPFLANDSAFVQAHLKFQEGSEMPPIELSGEEIRYISYYVAELHNSRLPKIPEDEIDAYDPVCYAPVSSERAKAQKLSATFRGETYYFATEKTMETFKQAPEAFVMLFQEFKQEKEKAYGKK